MGIRDSRFGRTGRPSVGGGSSPSGNLSSPGGLDRSTVYTGASIQDAINADVITEPGIVAYSFYSLTNAAGAMLRPGAAAAVAPIVPFRGSVIAVSVVASTACSGVYTVYIGGSATGALDTLATATSAYQPFIKGTYILDAGDSISVVASSVATSAAVEVTVYVTHDPSAVE